MKKSVTLPTGNRYRPPVHLSGLPYVRQFGIQMPMFDEDENGDGDGNADDEDADADANAEPDEAAVAAAVKFDPKDKKLYHFPGVEKPMTVAAYQKHVKDAYVPRQHVDGTMKVVAELSKLLKSANPGSAAVKPAVKAVAKATGVAEGDIIAQLEGMDGVIDGKTLAGVIKQMQSAHLDPIQKAVLALGKVVQDIRPTIAGVRTRGAQDEFGGLVTRITKQLKMPADNIEGADVVTDLIRDRFFSYEDADQAKLTDETFGKEVTDYFGKLQKFFRNYEKATHSANVAKQRKQLFARPGASASGNGKQMVRRSNRERAELLFGASNQPNAQ